VWCLTADPTSRVTTAVVDVTETLVPIVAGAACLRAARASVDAGLAWAFVGAGVIAWGLGQAVWTYYEVWRDVEVPFPSLADAGFLTFPVLASIGVVLYRASSRRRRSPVTTILDGALLAASLFTLSWFVLMQGLVADGNLSTFGFWLSFAYPVGDLVVVTLVLQVVSQLRTAPTSLWLLSLGLVVMAVADSAFVWLILTDGFATGGWVDLAWITAFAIIGAAGVQASRDSDHEEGRVDVTRLALVLPYVPFTLGMAVIAERVWTDDVGGMETLSAAVLIVLVLCRQYVALADNQGLLVLVRAREAELSHLALHDPLTGLANRLLLDDRMTHAASRRDDGSDGPLLLLIDLDDFKQVNDRHGHGAGDTVLGAVATRLSACVRSHDTVARLGGDEFAILLEPPTDPAEDVAQRVLDALAAGVDVDGSTVWVSASVGIGAVDRGFDAEATRVARALREADMAMYAAKAAGKNRWRRYGPDIAAFARPQPQDRNSPTTSARLLPQSS
jgi:diguanylate cyclase